MRIFLFLLIIFSSPSLKAQTKDSTLQYPLVIKFNSECCGVPDGTPLRKAVLKFKKTYHLKSIESYKIGPFGREGEYMVAFPLKEMNAKQKNNFIKKIKAVIPNLKDRGYAEYIENYSASTSAFPSSTSIIKSNFK